MCIVHRDRYKIRYKIRIERGCGWAPITLDFGII